MNETFFGEFTNKFNVSKTLRFELRPVGKTEEKIKESRILEQDELRSEYYPRMKEILDNGHKALLQEALSAFEMTEEGKRTDWKILEQAYDAFQKDKDKKALETVSKKYRSAITRIFKKFLSDKNSPYYKLAEESGRTQTRAVRNGSYTNFVRKKSRAEKQQENEQLRFAAFTWKK